MLLKFLNKPYPYIGNMKRAVVSNFLAGCFVAIFLLFFQPFGTANWQTPHKILKLCGFGFVSFIMPLLVQTSIALFFRRDKLEDKWNVGFEILSILIILLSITFGNMMYGKVIGTMGFSLTGFAFAFITVCLIGVFPVTLHVVLKHNRFLRMNLRSADEVNRQLEEHHHPEELAIVAEPEEHSISEGLQQQETQSAAEELEDSNDEHVLFMVAENGKDAVEIEYQNLLYIEAADNYSNIVFLEEGKVKKQLIRSSLKRTEEFIKNPLVLRCHRTFIVNLLKVNKVEGNAAGYRLILDNLERHIPVSRSYAQSVLSVLKSAN